MHYRCKDHPFSEDETDHGILFLMSSFKGQTLTKVPKMG